MSDPLALFSLALAAGGGRLDGVEVARSVAAGITLLQRSAPLVRALSGKRAAAVLPGGSLLLTALAASDGRGLVWVDPATASDAMVTEMNRHDAGAVFTTFEIAERLMPLVSSARPLVLLDQAPAHATVHLPDRAIAVDLGSHFGLSLEGDREAEGRDEECLLHDGQVHTHRSLLHEARAFGRSAALTPVDRTCTIMPHANVDLLVAGVAAPLLFGGEVFVTPQEDVAHIREIAATRLVGSGHDLQVRLTPH
ncbi:MAG TPA: hypothetical protein VGE27_05460 [Gemmatimonas sp.]|uniref:hypothetical protein n=1 Tax=Gemmatimonas sp. TaxID=1962908 RepID=UPI002ED8DC42